MTIAIRKPTAQSRVDARPAAALGAEIVGLDLSQPLDSDTARQLEIALANHGVLVFRDQRLTPEQHVALANALSGFDVNRYFGAVGGTPEVAEGAHRPRTNGDDWQSHRSYDRAPPKASILYARRLPSRRRHPSAAHASVFYAREQPRYGGDVLFASAEHAYDALSPGLKATVQGLRALHSRRLKFRPESVSDVFDGLNGRVLHPDFASRDAVHPVVFRHPLTGRCALYVNPCFTERFEGWTTSESAPLLNLLYEHIAREPYVYRLAWREGTLAIWDNRTTWRKTESDCQDDGRHLYRVDVAGAPIAAFDQETG